MCEQDIKSWMDSDETWWTGLVCDEDKFIHFDEDPDPDPDTRIFIVNLHH